MAALDWISFNLFFVCSFSCVPALSSIEYFEYQNDPLSIDSILALTQMHRIHFANRTNINEKRMFQANVPLPSGWCETINRFLMRK